MHQAYLDAKEKELGRVLTFKELRVADEEWFKLNPPKDSDNSPVICTPFFKEFDHSILSDSNKEN
jgi:hypothetical protein